MFCFLSPTALKSLLDDLDPCHDQPTHQWLSARVSDKEKNSEEDISLEDWFQNAPDRWSLRCNQYMYVNQTDLLLLVEVTFLTRILIRRYFSVKQKLASLLSGVSSNNPQRQTDDCKAVTKSVDIQVSPVHTCNSSDDTLRSTSPIADVDHSEVCTCVYQQLS